MLTSEMGPQGPEPGEVPAFPPARSGLAIASLVLAILGFVSAGLTAVVGLVLGILSLVRIRRSGGTLVGGGMAIAGIVISSAVILVLIPVFVIGREQVRRAICVSNMNQISLSLLQYAADYDDTFPPAANRNQMLHPYGGTTRVLVCPSVGGSLPDYAMNKSLGGVSLKSVRSREKIVGIFDSIPGINQAGGAELLPVPGRHDRGNNIGFADGHLKWYKDGNHSSIRWKP